MSKEKLYTLDDKSGDICLNSPLTMPNASGFLWNKNTLLQVNCRGYVVSQFLQPEPSKYSFGPTLEATTFMQPEHPYYAHHPGRFFYLKCLSTNQVCSLPYEPTRTPLEKFEFIVSDNRICWRIEQWQLNIKLSLTLAEEESTERWQLDIENTGDQTREFAIYPYFSLGYRSWMNQSATFDKSLNSIVAHNITPYQKVDDYYKHKNLKELTFLSCDSKPDSWTCEQASFEG